MSDQARIEQLADMLAERLAPRVADLLREEFRRDLALVGPDEIARQLGRSVEWVRDHATELAVIRLDDGPKARLWFRPDLVDERLRPRGPGTVATGGHGEPTTNGDKPQRPRTRVPGHTPSGAPLLEVKDTNGKRDTNA